MSSDIAYAILFGGLALLAQYLPARWGIPIGLAAVALSVWQLGWGGWPLWLGLALLGLVIWRIFLHRGLFEKDKEKEKLRNEKKAQARNIHNEIMELESQLENIKDRLSENEDWLLNPEIRGIMDKMQVKFNDLGYIINHPEYDRWAEDMMKYRAKQLLFHLKEHGSDIREWGRARINAKLRMYINKIRG